METLIQLLDKIKDDRSLASDAALAGLLHTTRASVSHWRKGHNLPDTVTCAQIAKMAGVPEIRVIGMVNAERARTQEERALWKRLASAACVVIALGMSGLSGKADAMPYQGSSGDTDNLYIIRSVIRWMVRLKVGLRKPLWWVQQRSNTTWKVDPHALA